MKTLKHSIAFIFILSITGCALQETTDNLDSKVTYENYNKTNLSKYIISMLKANEIETVTYDNGIYVMKSYDGNESFAEIQQTSNNKIVNLKLESGDSIKVTFNRSDAKIIKYNVDTSISTIYTDIYGVTKDIDKSLTFATSILYYSIEKGNSNYKGEPNPPSTSEKTYWCIRQKKSECNAEEFLTEYCGGEPQLIEETDCGCLWGDFACVCVTDFEC